MRSIKNALARLGRRRIKPEIMAVRAGIDADREIRAGSWLLGSRLSWLPTRRHWTGAELREIRHVKGCGRPPSVNLERQRLAEAAYQGPAGRPIRKVLRRGAYGSREALTEWDGGCVSEIVEAAISLGWIYNINRDQWESPNVAKR